MCEGFTLTAPLNCACVCNKTAQTHTYILYELNINQINYVNEIISSVFRGGGAE